MPKTKKDLFIHVGLGKAASTLLQEKVFSCHDGINYLGKTVKNYPRWLIEWHYLDDYSFHKKKKSMREELGTHLSNDKINLISSELFTHIGELAFSQACRIMDICPEARIILVLRDPIDIILSFYRYNVFHEKIYQPLEDLLEWERTPAINYKRKPIYLPGLLLDETVDIFNSMFGRENLCLLRFEHMKEGCVTDFLRPLEKFTGLRFNVPDEIATCRVNHSVLDDEKIAFRRIENLTELMFTNLEKFSFPERYHTKLRKAELISPGLETKLKKFFAGRSAGYY